MRRNRSDHGAAGWPLVALLIFAALAAGGVVALVGGAAGEVDEGTGVYSINCNLPASEVYNLSLAVEVPAGLVYQSESLAVSGAADLAAASVSATGPADGTGNLSLLLSFGTVNNSLDLDLLVEFVAVVADLPENTDGATLPPTIATLTYDNGHGWTPIFSGSIPGVSVVEPDLAASKRIVGPSASGGGSGSGSAFVYEISVFHTSNSSSPAYDVEVADLLAAGATVSPGSAQVVSGPTGTLDLSDPAGPKWSFDALDLSWTTAGPLVVQYEADGGGDGKSGGKLLWTSADGEVAEERLYSLDYDMDPYASLAVKIDANVVGVSVNGPPVSYVYTVKNDGLSNLTGLVLEDENLGPITLDKTSLAPGETATGLYLNRIVTRADLPGPLVNNATARATDEAGGEVSASGSISLPFFENHLSVTKIPDKKSVARGETVNYTITIANEATDKSKVCPTNIVVEDVFNRGDVEIISSDPKPDADGKWRYPELRPGKRIQIFFTIKVPEEQDFEFDMAQSVTGTGFVNVRNDYSTSYLPYNLRNCVYVDYVNGTTKEPSRIASCADVAIQSGPGTSLLTREHGSGSYDTDETVSVKTENRSIKMDKEVSAVQSSTTIGLYHGRSVTYSSPWTEEAFGKNRVTGATMSESYRRASEIDRSSRFYLDRNESSMEVESEFDGTGHIGFLKMPTNSSTLKDTPIFESREDYTGSFRVGEKIDEYGSAVSSEKSTSGTGLVAVDKRVGTSQKTYESGTGSYDSEELIETYTNYIAKDISLVSAPAEGSSLKWKEGIVSRTEGVSLISEEYTGATRLDKETVARGLNEMETEASFSGRARYRAVSAITSASENATDKPFVDFVDFDDIYEGDYSVQRKLLISGAPKYNRPHLNVTKTLQGISEETLPWGDEPHLAGAVKTRKVANYTISIENDGNRALAPIMAMDLLPPGTTFISSSLRPSAASEGSVNWTLTHLAIGGTARITLWLDVTGFADDELTNRVEVCGGYGDGDDLVCAANYTSLQRRWLTCCPEDEITVVKTARIDPENPMVVLYTVVVENNADATRAATVTDYLPQGMALIDSSLPVASSEDGVVVWVLPTIGPSEEVTIEFSALAPGLGRFTNVVEVEARSVDGPGTAEPLHVASVVQIGSSEECESTGCGIWQPPAWDFQRIGYEPDLLGCEIFASSDGKIEV